MKNIRQNGGRFAGSVEESVLRLGGCLVILWLVVCNVLVRRAPQYCVGILWAAGYHFLGGRAAGISAGLGAELPGWVVAVETFAVEVTLVCLFYPLAIYSYERGARRWFTGGTIEATIDAARTSHGKVGRWGVVGIVFFVWFPLYMTGPLVGAVVGYLVGLRPWVTLTAVWVGTALAIVSWVFVFDWLLILLEGMVEGIGAYIPLAVVVFVLATMVPAYLGRRWKGARTREDRPPGAPDTTPGPAGGNGSEAALNRDAQDEQDRGRLAS
jgi:uncharacterized membrane protein